MQPAYKAIPYGDPVGVVPFIVMCLLMWGLFYLLNKFTDEHPAYKQKPKIRRLKVAYIQARANWKGIPPDGLLRQAVWDKIKVVPMATEVKPIACPKCGKVLQSYKSDFDTNKHLFKVNGLFCASGHWTWLTWN